MNSYLRIEEQLVSVLLKMKIFQVKKETPELKFWCFFKHFG